VTSKPDFKVMVLLLVFMQLTRDLFAIAKFLFVLFFCHLFCLLHVGLVSFFCSHVNKTYIY